MMYQDETLWRRLMGKLVDVLGPFALGQVTAGARAIQVFDSWVGALSPDDYVRYVALAVRTRSMSARLTPYTRSSSRRSDFTRRPIFLITCPLMNPRTLCACQPV